VAIPYRVVAERRVTERLLQMNAVSPGSGQPLADLRGSDGRALRRLAASGVIRDEGAGRYYVYAPAYAAMRGHRRQRLILVLLFVALAMTLTAIAARFS
jgi:hypothetical protein